MQASFLLSMCLLVMVLLVMIVCIGIVIVSLLSSILVKKTSEYLAPKRNRTVAKIGQLLSDTDQINEYDKDVTLKQWISDVIHNGDYKIEKLEDSLFALYCKNTTRYTFRNIHVYIRIEITNETKEYIPISSLPAKYYRPGEIFKFLFQSECDEIRKDELLIDNNSIFGEVYDYNKFSDDELRYEFSDGTDPNALGSDLLTVNYNDDKFLERVTDDSDIRSKIKEVFSCMNDIDKYADKHPKVRNNYAISQMKDFYIPKAIQFVEEYNNIPQNDITRNAMKDSLLESLENLKQAATDLKEQLMQIENITYTAEIEAFNNKLELDGYQKKK